MRIFNADGSVAEMCGNGIRGFAKFVLDREPGAARPAARRDRRRRQDRRARAGRRARGPRHGRHGRAGVGRRARSRSTRTVRSSSGRSTSTAASTGHVRLDGEPALRRLPRRRRRPAARDARAPLRAPPLLPPPREHGVHPRRRTRATSRCGSGNAAPARRSPAAPAPARRRWRRRAPARTGRHVVVALPGGSLDIDWQADDHVRMTRRRGRGLRRLDRGVTCGEVA